MPTKDQPLTDEATMYVALAVSMFATCIDRVRLGDLKTSSAAESLAKADEELAKYWPMINLYDVADTRSKAKKLLLEVARQAIMYLEAK